MLTDLKGLTARLRTFSTTELCDGMQNARAMDCRIKPRVNEEKIVGPAYTVKPSYGISGIIPDAILAMKPGEVLVIAGEGFCAGSFWGDHRSLCADMKGAEGVVIDGAFRDLEGCRAAGFPVYARALIPRSAGKAPEGELNVPVVCGGVPVEPGDLIVGDVNGVIVLKPEEAEEVMKRALEKRESEERTIGMMKETGEILPRVLK